MSQLSKKYYFKSYSKTVYILNNQVFEDDNVIISTDPTSSNAEALKKSREVYIKIFSNPYENVIILSGAGTSKSSGGKSMCELWEDAKTELGEVELKKLYKKVKLPYPSDNQSKDLEKFLSQAQMAMGVLPDAEIGEVSGCIEKIKKIIKTACDLQLNNQTHLEFLNKLTARKTKYSRVKIFTLNYDTLFEQAGALGKYIVIDGFSFSIPRFFDPSFFDYDILIRDPNKSTKTNNYVQRLFHLYKPHGSINWQRDDDKILVADKPVNPQMIFPNTDKFEQSYEQPYFEMTSRLQRNLRLENTLLICLGFSFNDKHFRNMITEAARSNASLTVAVVLPSFQEKPGIKELLSLSDSHNNINFIDEKFEDFVKNYPYPEEYGYEQNQPTAAK